MPHYPTHYIPQGNADVFDTVVYRNVRLSDFTDSDVQNSDHLPIVFHILHHVSAMDILAPVEINTDSERFRSLTSVLISPRIQN